MDLVRGRRYALAKLLAMSAIVLQVLFVADHLGASAVRAFGKVAPESRMGFIEICTGAGIAVLAADGTPNDPDHDCPICDSVAVMAFGEPAETPWPTISFDCFSDDCTLLNRRQAAAFRLSQQQPIRAPPSALG